MSVLVSSSADLRRLPSGSRARPKRYRLLSLLTSLLPLNTLVTSRHLAVGSDLGGLPGDFAGWKT
eukprot:scaffold46078_cov16-Prasinocladus_malaysianus.AAC.1